MAIPVSIEMIIDEKVIESSRIDYKANWNPESIIHTITAFANDIDNQGGGYIIIGIEDDNGMPKVPVKGVDRSKVDSIHEELVNKCNLINPRYIPEIENVEYSGKTLVMIWAPGGHERPYRCPVAFPGIKSQKTDLAYFIRKGSVTVKANEKDIKALFELSADIPFDDRINLTAQVDDIKEGLIDAFLYEVDSKLSSQLKGLSLSQKVQSLHLIGGPQENPKPLNISLLFFNEDPEKFFPYSRIEIVEKPDPTGEGMTERTITGPLDWQIRSALQYLSNSVIAEKVFKLPGQAEALRFYNYPYAALEEALVNAVYHKSYQIHEPITVTILSDRIEITSVPGPDRSISDEDLKNLTMVSRTNRNRRIGDFLKELHLAEARNTGIPTIVKAMKQNSSPDPVFLTDDERSYFTVVLPMNKAFEDEQSKRKKAGQRTIRKPNEVKESVVALLRENGDLSSSELAVILGYPRVVNSLSLAIKALMNEGVIEYTDKGNLFSRTQKLHLK